MIGTADLPTASLLRRYLRPHSLTDCFFTDVPCAIALEQYVEAFYTTVLFKLERMGIRWFVGRPSTDADAGRLARGEVDELAVWHVEARTSDQILLRDFSQRTRSWLMVQPAAMGTCLYFGSAVVPLTSGFRMLLGFHRLYSRVLLGAAARRSIDRAG